MLDLAEAASSASGVTVWLATDEILIGEVRPTYRERSEIETHFSFGVCSGSSEVTVDDRRPVTVAPDGVRFHNAGERICTRKSDDNEIEWWVAVSPLVAEAIAAGVAGPSHAPFPQTFLRPDLVLLAALRRLLREARVRQCGFWACDALAGVLPALLRAPDKRDQRSATAGQVKLARDLDAYFSRHYAEPQSFARLSQLFNVSSSYLARSYRAAKGMRMHEQLSRLRIAAALARLDQGERNLAALALDLGFSSHSHFSTEFRRSIGQSPAAFRSGSEI